VDFSLSANAEPLRARATLQRFYETRNGALAWTGPANTTAYRELVEAIRAADRHGLDPADYHLAELANGNPETGALRLDQTATDAYLALAAHLLSGRLDPLTVEPNWTAAKRGRDLAAYLEGSLGNGAIRESLDALAPTQSGYADLQIALARYRKIDEGGGWPKVDEGKAIALGDRGQRVVQLRKRLAATGDLVDEGGDPELFDVQLVEGVRRFQQQTNLEPDGVVGARTLAQLNASVANRIAQIRANMERWRWLPDDLGRRHIRVNIADFRAEARANGRVERTHDIIVGRVYRKTPVFPGAMTYLVLNPWWETPPNLAVKDKLPAFRKDPQMVETLGFQVIDRSGKVVNPKRIDWNAVQANDFPYRIRQAPGPQNALGNVKFMFPNRHNVYLHDTPTRGLFAQTRRDFSSGCVRVQDALDLAAWVLVESPDWPIARIRRITEGNTETRVILAHSIPVHILYWTVVPDEQTTVRFLDDVYERDQKLISALDR
jgi:murein L,D-transpeptidase YcbB/YkuD